MTKVADIDYTGSKRCVANLKPPAVIHFNHLKLCLAAELPQVSDKEEYKDTLPSRNHLKTPRLWLCSNRHLLKLTLLTTL